MKKIEIEADKYAYQMCGSSPCEDCNKFKHEIGASEKLYDCVINGGCIDKEAYDHDYEMYKQEYINKFEI